MNEIKITIDTFVEELNNCVGKEAFDVLKKHITRTYIPYEEKCSICERIAKASTRDTINGIEFFKINSHSKKMLYAVELFNAYTDVDVDFVDGGALYCYNKLMENGIFVLFLSSIPSVEIEEFEEVLKLTFDDIYENERSIFELINGKINALQMFLEDGLAFALQNSMNTNDELGDIDDTEK